MEALIYTRLIAVAANVYPGKAPLGFFQPAVIYNRVTTTPNSNLDDDDDTGTVRFQIDVYDESLFTAQAQARSIRSALKSWSAGTISHTSFRDEMVMIDETTSTSLFRIKLVFDIVGII